jgi:hypothetical protein
MHASYQERKGHCRVLDCPASKVLFTVGSSCLAHLNHKWPGSVVFFFFGNKFCHFLIKKIENFLEFFFTVNVTTMPNFFGGKKKIYIKKLKKKISCQGPGLVLIFSENEKKQRVWT